MANSSVASASGKATAVTPGVVALAALVVVYGGFLALLAPYAVTSPHNLNGFGTLDGNGKSYAVFADICGDGDHNTPLYFVWAVEKALAGTR